MLFTHLIFPLLSRTKSWIRQRTIRCSIKITRIHSHLFLIMTTTLIAQEETQIKTEITSQGIICSRTASISKTLLSLLLNSLAIFSTIWVIRRTLSHSCRRLIALGWSQIQLLMHCISIWRPNIWVKMVKIGLRMTKWIWVGTRGWANAEAEHTLISMS